MRYGVVTGVPLVAMIGLALTTLLPAEVAVGVVVGVAVLAIVVITLAVLVRPRA